MVGPSLSSSQLKQFLDINTKAIELHLEVSNQYEEAIDLLKLIKLGQENQLRYDERFIERVNEAITRIELKVKEDHVSLNSANSELKKMIIELDKSMIKQTVITIGTVLPILAAFVAKMFGLPIP